MPQPRSYFSHHWYGHYVRFDSYDSIKQKYEQTKPLQGAWRKQFNVDVRPMAARRRRWEIWHHDPETNAYGVAFAQVYPQVTTTNKTGGKTVYASVTDNRHPLLMIYPNGDIKVEGVYFNSYSTWELLGALMPEGITFVKYGAKCYFKVQTPDGPMHYFFPKTNMTFIPYESEGKRYYRVAAPMREVKHLIDRDKAKIAREEFNVFMNYYELMSPLMPLTELVRWKEKAEAKKLIEDGTWLWRKAGEEFGEKWPDAISALKKLHAIQHHSWNEETKHSLSMLEEPSAYRIKQELHGEKFYRVFRPYTRELVPLGTPFFSNGRD